MERKEDMRFDTLRRAAALGLACVLVWGGVPAPALAEMVEEADVPAADTVADDPKDADAALEAQGSTKADAEVPEAEPAPVAVDDLPLEDAAAPVQQDSADAEVPAISVQADGDYIARGTWGNCPWEIDSSGTLTVRPGEGASQSSSVSPWDSWKDSISSIRFVAEGNRDVVAPSDCSYLFAKLSHVTSVDLAGLNTSSVTNMREMFKECGLTTVGDLSDWDTASVTDMHDMFFGCSRLASIGDLSNWNTSGVTDMGGMFEGCSSLVTINGLSGWTTSSVTDMSDMFFGCKKLASLDLSGWNTSSVTSVNRMFKGCTSLTAVGNLSKWDTGAVTDMYNMFHGCSSLTAVDGLSEWTTSNVTDMSSMFHDCSSLASLDLSGWNILSGPMMGSMFYGCSSLASLDLSNWDTSNVVHMNFMFYDCSTLTTITGLSDFNTSSAMYMSYMFSGCASLTSLDLSRWNIASATSARGMFHDCSLLTTVGDLSGWNTSHVEDMSYMFSDCPSLTSLGGLSGWDVSSVMDMSYMFHNCSSLKSLDLSGWNTASANRTAEMFAGCMSLESISVGANYQIKGADMFPEVTAPNGMWWSTRDHWWYTEDDVVLERSGVADTYTSVAEPGFAVSISAATVASIKGHGYDGKPYEPKPEVTLGGRKLVEGTDFDYSYKNNVSASNGGSATVTVTGKNNYTGTKTVGFDIWKMGQPMEAWKVARSASAASLATRDVVVEAPIHVAHAVSAAKPMEFRKVGGDSRLNVDVATGRVTVRRGTRAGTYGVTIRAIAFGGANYADGSKIVDCQVKVVSGKLDQEMEVKAADVSRTAASLASADYLTRPFSVALAAGNVTYKLAGGSGCLGVDSSGRLRITRGTKAGTYYAKVWVTAAGDVGYKPCTRTVTAKVVVR